MRKLIAALMSLMLLVAVAPQARASDFSFLAPPASQPLYINLISTDGTPLADAEVQLLTPGMPGITTVRTNQQGQATLDLPAGFSFWLRIWANGHALIERPYVPASDGQVLTLTASPYTAFLTGILRDQRGMPVPQAQLSLFRDGYGLEATAMTNDLGIYTLDSVRADGEYTLQVHATGFRPVSQALGALDPARRNQVDLTLTPADGQVTGEVVTGAANRPVGGVRVELLLSGWGPVASTTTDGTGYFALSAPPLENGAYQLRLSRYDYETATTASFTMADGGWYDYSGENRLTLNRLYAEISGKLFGNNADTLSEVEVHLQRQGLGTVEVAKTDEDGRFTFKEVPSGAYRVRSFPKGSLTHADTGWLEVTGGQTITANIVAKSPDTYTYGSANLSGTVKNHLDEPVEGAEVKIYHGSQTWTEKTDEEGRYDASLEANIPESVADDPGTGYHVSVSVDGYLANDQPESEEAASSLVDIRSDVDNQANFVLQPEYAAVAGRVVDSQGRFLAGVKVGLMQEGRSKVAEAVSDETGRYRFEKLPIAKQSRYLPVVLDDGYVNGAVGPNGAPFEPAALSAASPVSLTLVGHPNMTTFLGLVQAGDNRPADGAVVTVLRPADSREYVGEVEADGSYQIKLPATPGEQYLVRARSQDSTTATTAEVVQPGTNYGVQANLTTHVAASITGRVVGPDGLPVAAARVMLYAEGSSVVDFMAFTDASGRYRFEGLIPGRRYAVVASDGWVERSALAPGEPVVTPLIGLPSGETVWADIQLQTLPAMTVPVPDVTVPGATVPDLAAPGVIVPDILAPAVSEPSPTVTAP